jgi:two-component system sensor histidine kinase SenX3
VTEFGSQQTAWISEDISNVLAILPQPWLIVAKDGMLLKASERALELGVVLTDRVENLDLLNLIAAAADGENVTDGEVILPKTRTHEEKVLRIRATHVCNDVLVILEDATEERRLDEVRRDFVANISHELKTPVGALSLLAEAIEAAVDDPASLQHFAQRMRRETARLSSLVGDLIDLSRLQSDELLVTGEQINVDALVTQVLDDVQTVAKNKDIEIVVGGTGNLMLWGQRDQLASALRNLLTNAINYSHPGTRVALGTKLVDDFVEISVVDQGIGIAAADLERIFERFYRVDPARSRFTGGTGLGLSIVKHICAVHGGECTVWSQEGHGSTFTMRIPKQSPLINNLDANRQGEGAEK